MALEPARRRFSPDQPSTTALLGLFPFSRPTYSCSLLSLSSFRSPTPNPNSRRRRRRRRRRRVLVRVRIDSSRHSSRGDPFQSPTCCCGGGRTPRRRALWAPPRSGSSSSARATASPLVQRLAPPRRQRLLLGQVRVAAQQVWSSFLGIPRSYSASATRSTKSLCMIC